MAIRRIAFGVAVSGLGVFTSLLNYLWLIRAVAAEVAKEDLGFLVSVWTFVSYFGLLQLSLDLAAAQRIAEAYGRQDWSAAARIYRQLVWFNKWLALCGVVVIATGAAIVSAHSSVTNGWLVATCGLCVVVSICTTPVIAVLSGSQAMHLVAIVRLGGSVAGTVSAYFLLMTGMGVLCLPLSQLLVSVIQYFVFYFARLSRCKWTLDPIVGPWVGFRDLARFAVAVSYASGFAFIEGGCDPFVFQLSAAAPLKMTADFSIWNRFPLLAAALGALITAHSNPAIMATLVGNREAGFRLYRWMLLASACVGAVATFGLGCWLSPVVDHWLSGEYNLPNGLNVSVVLASLVGLKVLSVSLASICTALGLTRSVTVAYALLAGMKVCLGLLLVPSFGLIGLALAWVVGQFAAFVWLAISLRSSGALRARDALVGLGLTSSGAVLGYVGAHHTEDFELISTIYGIAATVIVLTMVLGMLFFILRKRPYSLSPNPTSSGVSQ